jgi:hypothetical protein
VVCAFILSLSVRFVFRSRLSQITNMLMNHLHYLCSDAKRTGANRQKQGSPATRHGGTWGERRYGSYSSWTSALGGVSGERHAPAALCHGERTPGTYCTGGWVGLRAGLDTEVRGKILFLYRGSNPDRPVVLSVVRHYTD